MTRFILIVCSCALVVLGSSAFAQTSTTFTYQGSLAESAAPANGPFNLDFSLFDALSGGTQVGSTIVMNGVPVSEGLLTVELDFGASAFDNTGRWLEIVVDGTTLSPRQPITRAPYSIQTRGIFVDENNNVGIGTATPAFPLEVVSAESITIFGDNTATSGDNFGVYGKSSSRSGRGVYGFATGPFGSGSGSGVYGETSSSFGHGVYGIATSTSGTNYGGRFENNSASGYGVFAEATASIGPTRGVYGLSRSPTGYGVQGVANASSGSAYGVYGLSHSTSGRGLFGWAFANSGTTFGVYGEVESTTGRGVYGTADALSGINYGGWFETNSTTGRGVFGLANRNSGINYGVVGHSNSASGFDFWASGAGTNYGSPSSRRWKSNIVPIGDPLDKLAKLQGVYFDWDDEHSGNHDLGMIAEVVGEVLPEIVQYEENGIDAIGMDYSKMTPLLVEAVNALRAEKDSQLAEKDEQIEMLSFQIEYLEQRLTQLERRFATPAVNGDQ
jgi:Chaperone of endosialidase